jgi:hypothetical protein
MKLRRCRNAFKPDTWDLFAWANIAERRYVGPLSLPARRIRERFGLSPAAAIVTAELAGFTGEGR